MAAQSSNRARRAAVGARGVHWRSFAGLLGRTHGRRCSCHWTGGVVDHGEVGRVDAGPSLGARTESLSAIGHRRSGSRAGVGGLRPSAQRGFTLLRVPVASGESAPAPVGTTRVDRAANVRCRTSASSVGSPGGPTQLCRVHASNRRSFHYPDAARRVARCQWRHSPCSLPGRLVSTASGASDGGRCGRSGAWTRSAGRFSFGVCTRATWIDGSDGSGLRSHARRSHIPDTAVQQPARHWASLSLGS